MVRRMTSGAPLSGEGGRGGGRQEGSVAGAGGWWGGDGTKKQTSGIAICPFIIHWRCSDYVYQMSSSVLDNSKVYVVCATNRPWCLDSALCRPGAKIRELFFQVYRLHFFNLLQAAWTSWSWCLLLTRRAGGKWCGG